jgi:predicted GIY-YIG superfamily endonuclease
MTMNSTNPYFTYILRCADGSYYVGHTDNLPQRLATHNFGGGGSYTVQRRPAVLVYSEPQESLEKAVQREIQLTHWSRAKKEALIAGNGAKLKSLAKRRR